MGFGPGIVAEDCVFENDAGYGVHTWHAVRPFNVHIRDNGAGGLRLRGIGFPYCAEADGVLIPGNRGHGCEAHQTGSLQFRDVGIEDNGGWGMWIDDGLVSSALERTVVADNAVSFAFTGPPHIGAMSCVDISGNVGSDWVAGSAGLPGQAGTSPRPRPSATRRRATGHCAAIRPARPASIPKARIAARPRRPMN